MLSNRPATKGIMFGGCSFTWGQGLYYYSNLDTLQEPLPDCFDPNLLTSSHLRYMESVRYPRIVAKHFDAWEVVHPYNSGSNLSIIKYWSEQFTKHPGRTHADYQHSEISHFVFQLTQHHRDNFIMEFEGVKRNIPFHEVQYEPIKSIFPRWVNSLGLTLDQWMDQYIAENIQRVEIFLKDLESKGIKTLIMCWPDEYVNLIKGNPWFVDRLVTFKYKDVDYVTIQSMMKANKELEIKQDYTNFVYPPKDHHPSLLCHQVMADHVIKAIKK